MSYLERIRIDPAVRSGKPTIRATRITVHDILEYLASGMSQEEILAGFPDLSPEDIRAALRGRSGATALFRSFVRLLFDENLSFRLVRELADVYPDSAHVRDVGLRGAEDQRIWEYAAEHGFLVASKDIDFYQRSLLYGAQGDLAPYRECTYRNGGRPVPASLCGDPPLLRRSERHVPAAESGLTMRCRLA